MLVTALGLGYRLVRHTRSESFNLFNAMTAARAVNGILPFIAINLFVNVLEPKFKSFHVEYAKMLIPKNELKIKQ